MYIHIVGRHKFSCFLSVFYIFQLKYLFYHLTILYRDHTTVILSLMTTTTFVCVATLYYVIQYSWSIIFHSLCVCFYACVREEGESDGEKEKESLRTCEPTSAISNYIIPIIRLTYCWKEKRRICKLSVTLPKTQYDILPGTCVFIRFMYLKCVRRKPTLNH